jgi:purine-binding chemotaxis protein CheW
MELLTFRLSQQDYALDIMSVREIRSWTRATPLPHSPSFMKGVINLRGTVLPVMDLANRLDLPAPAQSARSVIIVVHHEATVTGLLVDAVSDIVTLSPEDLQTPPEMATAGKASGLGVVRDLAVIDDKMIRILDLPAVVTVDDSAAA